MVDLELAPKHLATRGLDEAGSSLSLPGLLEVPDNNMLTSRGDDDILRFAPDRELVEGCGLK
jgi:hypothetical protein